MNPLVTEVFETDPVKAFSALHHLPYSIYFDSADRKHPAARYSFICAYPLETIEAKNGRITVTNSDEKTSWAGDPFEVLKERLAYYRLPSFNPSTPSSLEGGGKGEGDKALRHHTPPHPDPLPKGRGDVGVLPPFQGGAAGFFGYDLGRCIEKMPDIAADNPEMPDMAVGIYDQVLAFDHAAGKTWLITHAEDKNIARARQRFLLSQLMDAPGPAVSSPADMDWEPNFDAFDYRQMVAKVIEYIRAGDIFQANVSQRFDAPLPPGFCSFAHYCALRRVNPAPFAGYMNAGGVQISSASPERFLTVENGAVETRPIKGTRPRAGDPVLDKVYRSELENNEKERAENTMIVDLLRNDLSKVCTPDSVIVKDLCKLESFASVHHLVSTIRGKLQEGKSAIDLLRACFPGGSISGAPKIRAMEIIEELEPTRRGPYCGSMGYIGFDGTTDSNILIRTLVYEKDRVSFQAGGGITADSNPDQEYQETFDKADALFRSFDGVQDIDEDYALMIGAE